MWGLGNLISSSLYDVMAYDVISTETKPSTDNKVISLSESGENL